jgi:putative Mg2+ transporter-C (MgtC) family protein
MDLSVDWSELELTVRILASVVFGAIIGFEREMTRKPAGLRTHILVCMGACLFTLASFYLTPDDAVGTADATRIAAGIVTGIGFIGAGSIIASGANVKGLTTAASLWLVGAIGLMVGLGNYLFSAVAAVLGFVVLRLGYLERRRKRTDSA